MAGYYGRQVTIQKGATQPENRCLPSPPVHNKFVVCCQPPFPQKAIVQRCTCNKMLVPFIVLVGIETCFARLTKFKELRVFMLCNEEPNRQKVKNKRPNKN